jgi:hypothetical protein
MQERSFWKRLLTLSLIQHDTTRQQDRQQIKLTDEVSGIGSSSGCFVSMANALARSDPAARSGLSTRIQLFRGGRSLTSLPSPQVRGMLAGVRDLGVM